MTLKNNRHFVKPTGSSMVQCPPTVVSHGSIPSRILKIGNLHRYGTQLESEIGTNGCLIERNMPAQMPKYLIY